MNKIFLKTFFAISLLIQIFPSSIHAADMSIGATAWYTAWDFEWEGTDDLSYDPGFLYGPVFSLAMTTDLSLSFVFLYGKFEQLIESNNETSPLKRYDSDLALNYRISNYFRLFGGLKYIAFTWDPNGKHQALGPGAGISYVIPMGGDFFILGNISGMYLKGNEKGNIGGLDYDINAEEYGFNGSLSLSYYIPASSTTISLGGRYQMIRIEYETPLTDMVENSTSRFYGVTLTAVYTFNI